MVSFFKANPNLQSKKMGDKDKKHVPVPGVPRPGLVMVNSKETFAFFETLLDGPAQGSGAVELFPGKITRSVAEGVPDFDNFRISGVI